MSAYYYYINHDKKQYFSIGIIGYGIKWNCLGQTPGARALNIMLTEDKYWKNNRICVIGDDNDETEFEEIIQKYQNIDIDAIMLLFKKDGLEAYEDHLESSSTFMMLCEMALILGNKKINKYLLKKYGKGWIKKYNQTLKASPRESYSEKIENYKRRVCYPAAR